MGRRGYNFFEHHQQPLASKKVFRDRMIKCVSLACFLLAGAILLGASVYHYAEGLGWVDAVLNSVLIITGLGLVDPLHTLSGKIFTSFYALLGAVVFYMVLAIIFAPLIHRFLHRFHLELERHAENS